MSIIGACWGEMGFKKYENTDFHNQIQAPLDALNYRFFCFGEARYIQASDLDLYGTRYFYDTEWRFQNFTYNHIVLKDEMPRPKLLEQAVRIANTLALSFSFVRVDLYVFPHSIIVGELTFTPEGGTGRYTPREWDRKLGDLWL